MRCTVHVKHFYRCYGYFYTLRTSDGFELMCRSTLDILRKGGTFRTTEMTRMTPDALVIMMNPGSSRPSDQNFDLDLRTIRDFPIDYNTIVPVPTQPDPTQYRLMKLMFLRHWRHVKVINLSDICEAKPNILNQKMSCFYTRTLCSVHSIFSEQRTDELQSVLTLLQENTPIIKAWGTHGFLNLYARNCLKRIKSHQKQLGLQSPQNNLFFYHPRVTSLKWWESIHDQLNL